MTTSMPRRTRTAIGALRLNLLIPVVAPLAVLAVLLVVWSAYARSSGGSLFPTPTQVAVGFWDALTSGHVWSQTMVSWRSLVIGYVLSAVIGIALGLLLGSSRLTDRTLGVYLDIALVTPMIVMMPIVLIALGVTRTAEVVVVMFFSIPYVTLPIRNGVRAMPQLWFDLSRSLCASRLQVWRFILLPGARSVITHGLRLGLAHALSGLLVVEFTLVALGIGQVVLDAKAAFDFGSMIGYLLLVMAQVLVVMGALRLVDREREGAET